MTTSHMVLEEWTTRPMGKATRITIAAAGMITAFMTMMLATAVSTGGWFLIMAGIALAATSARAARVPSLTRLMVVIANLLVIPLVTPIF